MFSVLLPAFKLTYLREAIDSVLAQSFRDFELIIVNDRSPEDIAGLVATYSDNRISYFENEFNLGSKNLVYAWNRCVELANREYGIIFSDDDILHERFLEEISLLIAKYPAHDLFYTRPAVIDKNGALLRLTTSSPEWEDVYDFIWHRVSGKRDLFAQNFVFRLSALKSIGGFVDFPMAWASDDATWFLLSKSKGVVASSKALVYWRWSEINISNTGNFKHRLEAVKPFQEWCHNFVEGLDDLSGEHQFIKNQILRQLPLRTVHSEQYLLSRLFRTKGSLRGILFYIRNRNHFGFGFKGMLKLMFRA